MLNQLSECIIVGLVVALLATSGGFFVYRKIIEGKSARFADESQAIEVLDMASDADADAEKAANEAFERSIQGLRQATSK